MEILTTWASPEALFVNATVYWDPGELSHSGPLFAFSSRAAQGEMGGAPETWIRWGVAEDGEGGGALELRHAHLTHVLPDADHVRINELRPDRIYGLQVFIWDASKHAFRVSQSWPSHMS